MKRAISLFLALLLCLALGASALAVDEGEARMMIGEAMPTRAGSTISFRADLEHKSTHLA